VSDQAEAAGDGGSEETGRYLIFYHPEALSDTAQMAINDAGIAMPSTAADAEFATASGGWREMETVVIPSLGVAVSSTPPDQLRRLETGGRSPIRHVRKEYVFRIAAETPETGLINVSAEYLRGYQAGVQAVAADLLSRTQAGLAAEIQDTASVFRDSETFTWGLQATGVDQSQFTGNGVQIAVLDTGFDSQHPDFIARGVESQSFITGVPTARDDNGHGTHCLGTLGGPRVPAQGPRYGVAHDVQLFVGKVMKADGKGSEGDILHGIGWALQNNCRVVSLSLGRAVARGGSRQNVRGDRRHRARQELPAYRRRRE
jgi:subtilisin family serine protease